MEKESEPYYRHKVEAKLREIDAKGSQRADADLRLEMFPSFATDRQWVNGRFNIVFHGTELLRKEYSPSIAHDTALIFLAGRRAL